MYNFAENNTIESMNYGFIISGTIGKEYDWWTGQKGTTVKAVKDFLDANKGKEVDIAISSPGGYVAEGLTILQYIKDHGNVNCHIMGMSASIATVLAMGAKTVTMASGSLMLIHQASSLVNEWQSANKDELDAIIAKWQKERKDLDTIDKVIASVYAERNKHTVEECLEKMKEAAWLTPDDALEFGLIDSIRRDEEDAKRSATVVRNFANSFYVVNGKMGLPPMPQIADANGEPTEGFIEKTVNRLKSIFQSSKNTANKTITTMKNFVALCGLLVLNAIEFIDGKVSFTEDQVKKIDGELLRLQNAVTTAEDAKKQSDTALANLQKQLQTAQNDLAAANAQIENLKKGPGAPKVEEPAHQEETPMSAQDMYNSIKDYL